ncbi:winged helix-turn-helix domain-containing protein [Microbacterium rhizomatis]|uniref:Helix-turn-helix transcriptional regulator n=1 Tax=Microbacterium rhizomatis TaxID=1631477 RepID=A0A5J5J5L0_9MICO|nr:helix-turn-helix domain-containing protein [Microbacterium rhizomatis]KAA9110709.1 helix-turn-helix transcriptional regulator [Microbacterium rhizomatis]
MGVHDVEARLSALEQTVTELQGRFAADASRPNSDMSGSTAEALWALEGLKTRSPEGGAVLYTGAVDLPTGGAVQWQYSLAASEVLAQDWTKHADLLDALGHPIRLAILQAVLQGTVTASGLVETLESGTSGQVYHHLKELTTTGWLAPAGRGAYEVPAARVVPLLAILVAAGTPR